MLSVMSDQHGQVAVLVNVCIEATGPYPFVVDTGASSTAVDAALVKRLELKAVGPAVTIPEMGGPGEPVGVIGSDVWNRFRSCASTFGAAIWSCRAASEQPRAERC